jgi:hypothetical protein
MLNKLGNFLKNSSETGLRLPLAYDPDKRRASVTMLFTYVGFLVAICAVIFLSVQDPIAGTSSAIILWTLSTVFYLMRRLNKFKADLRSDSIELDSTESPNDKES